MAAVSEVVKVEEFKEKRKREVVSDWSGEGAWINAHHNPVASLSTFTSCLDLRDLDGDGDYKLLVGDIADGQNDMKLKVFKGTIVIHEISLLDIPTGVVSFMMDTNEPAIAVASGTNVYIYKTVRPYFKFTLPLLDINKDEKRLWAQAKEDMIDTTSLREGLDLLRINGCSPPLTVRSLTFLQLEADDIHSFATIFKPIPLRRQTVVTCITTLYKSYSDDTSANCMVIGTENKDVYILDPAAFTFLSRFRLKGVPMFLSCHGIYDVDFSISVACRDGCIHTLCKDQHSDILSIPSISLSSQAVGLLRDEQTITVATMNRTLSCYTGKGKLLWSTVLPDDITAMERMDYKMRSFKAVIIALANNEVRVYKDKFIVNTFKVDDRIVGMKFGQFGREEGSLILVSQSGAMTVKILKRNVVFEVKELKPGPVTPVSKITIAKKTKEFVDQSIREKENAKSMHETFQQHLLQLKLESAKSYIKAISCSLTPVTNTAHTTLSISAQVTGIGPLFKVLLLLQNTSPNVSLIDHYIIIQSDQTLYNITNKYITLPMLIPGVPYSFSTIVECLNDYGQTDSIKVCVHCHGNPVTLLTAVIDMPASENIVL